MTGVDGVHTTTCPLDCPDTCSLAVEVVDGRITTVDAAPGNPLTAGFICQKVKHHARRVYAPERVLTPLVRTGPKGAGEFQAASWDEALDLVVARMRDAIDRSGPASIVPYLYSSSAPALQTVLPDRFFGRLRASYVLDTICAATHAAAYEWMFDAMPSADPFDVEHAGLVLVWGANPAIANTHFPPLVRRAQDRGAKLVVVDPRRTGFARSADVHLAVRPGTDVALALAVARELFAADLVERSAVEPLVDDLDAYLAAAEEWTLDRAAEVCGVTPAAIAALAADLARVHPVFVRVGWGVERNRNGGSACAAVFALPVLAGGLGRLGGGVMASLSGSAPLSVQVRDPAVPPDAPRRRRLNMNEIGRFLTDPATDPPVRVLFVIGANPAVMAPNQTLVLEGLARDDLFTVVHEQVLTDTARFADVVLPATTHFEADDLSDSYGSFTLQPVRAVIDRVGESVTNNELAAMLAVRFGFDPASYDADPAHYVPASVADDGDAWTHRVIHEPGTQVQLRDTFPTTPSGKVRLTGFPGLGVPRYRPLDSQFPLTLISPATAKTINSMFAEFDPPEAVLRVHPDDAETRAIVDGALVRVWNDRAELSVRAVLDDTLRPGVVAMPKGLWRRDVPGGLTVNAFAPDDLSDLAGGATFNDARVDITPAG
ncbi:MAG TPA: molybdopterin-dependent oxidoreductase [Acidimicrobiia bacterium]|nr:molybdopterin-dependent oxidoreductase [Acidimicrobiia bacterium]